MSNAPSDTPKEKPPLFQSWRVWYMLVLGVLVVQIILYYWITRSFA